MCSRERRHLVRLVGGQPQLPACRRWSRLEWRARPHSTQPSIGRRESSSHHRNALSRSDAWYSLIYTRSTISPGRPMGLTYDGAQSRACPALLLARVSRRLSRFSARFSSRAVSVRWRAVGPARSAAAGAGQQDGCRSRDRSPGSARLNRGARSSRKACSVLLTATPLWLG